MKFVCAFLLFCGALMASAAERAVVLPALTGDRVVALQLALNRATYPAELPALIDKLGGKEGLVWCCGRTERHGGKSRDFHDYAISDPASAAGFYGIEFETRETGKAGAPEVIAARLCFVSPFGARFYAEDLKERFGAPKEGANQAPQPTTGLAPGRG